MYLYILISGVDNDTGNDKVEDIAEKPTSDESSTTENVVEVERNLGNLQTC